MGGGGRVAHVEERVRGHRERVEGRSGEAIFDDPSQHLGESLPSRRVLGARERLEPVRDLGRHHSQRGSARLRESHHVEHGAIACLGAECVDVLREVVVHHQEAHGPQYKSPVRRLAVVQAGRAVGVAHQNVGLAVAGQQGIEPDPDVPDVGVLLRP